jgi:hypothetical protein
VGNRGRVSSGYSKRAERERRAERAAGWHIPTVPGESPRRTGGSSCLIAALLLAALGAAFFAAVVLAFVVGR